MHLGRVPPVRHGACLHCKTWHLRVVR
jgi:hypothetical protein